MINWGILGSGTIAGALADAISQTEGGRVAAVASRSRIRAAEFAERFHLPASYGAYGDLLADDAIDAIYVATTNDLHCQNTLDAMAAGKAVLCEKPFAVNGREAEEMVAAARRSGTFLMEAMWTRFVPAVVRLRELVAAGRLGELKAVSGDLSFVAGPDPDTRHLSPRLGGGALLDLGVYPISFAFMLLGEPATVAASAALAETGVDEQVAVALGYSGGAVATAYASLIVDSPSEGHVVGTDARVRVHSRINNPHRLDLFHADQSVEVIDVPYAGSGYRFEVEEVHRSLGAGLTESAVMPLSDSLGVMRVLDEARRQIGVEFPQD